MIILDRVTKYFHTPMGRHYVLRDVSLTVPLGRNIGVLGRNGAGKSTLLRIMAGVDYPNRGKVTRIGSYSWPLALAGRGVQGTMTARENVIFAARIHGMWGKEIERLVDKVEEFAELDDFFDMPVSTYSSGMRARLSFSIAMLFDFDCYFIDELNAVGDARFRRITREYFEQSRRTATFIQVSHDLKDLHKICDAGLLVNDGQVTFYEHVDDAIAAYRQIVGDAGDFEEDEERSDPVVPEIAPVVAASSRQARLTAAKVRQRRIRREAERQSAGKPAPAAEAAPVETVIPAAVQPQSSAETQPRRRIQRRRSKAANRHRLAAAAATPVPAQLGETEADRSALLEARAKRQARLRSLRQRGSPLGLSPSQHLKLKTRRNKPNQTPAGQD